MLFPDHIVEAVAKTFYDKEISIMTATETIDSEGGVNREITTTGNSFFGNVRFSNLGEVKDEMGLVEAIDICITCRASEQITLNDLIKYNEKTYLVTSVIPTDSHLTIVGKLWEKQQ